MENLLRSYRCRLGMGDVRAREDFLFERESALCSVDARLRERVLRTHLSPSARRTSDSFRAAWLPCVLQGAPIPLRHRLRPLNPEQGDGSILPPRTGPLSPLGE